MAGPPVFVIGGGNSAGQAALHLAKFAKHVTLLVRGPSLAASMSEYLIDQIRSTRNVDIRHRSAVVGGRSGRRLPRQRRGPGPRRRRRESIPTPTGCSCSSAPSPHTDWLDGTVQRDEAGFLLTGNDVDRSGPTTRTTAAPCRCETSLPGVFAIGDTRRGSVKRVATAVGDGASAVQQLHRYLAQASRPHRRALT